MPQPPTVGPLLRQWRNRRGWSQAELAADAEISARHLSFIETGRSLPGRAVLLRLAVPLREQNAFLVGAGYAPHFPERPLHALALADVQRAVQAVLAGAPPGAAEEGGGGDRRHRPGSPPRRATGASAPTRRAE